tara:strand:+ start:262 stop:600 length:339 start_codon:yes stop_codon:yes gene_type:complete
MIKENKIGIIGLGYVGLPLALSFTNKFMVVGYEKSLKRINELNLGMDANNEFTKLEIKKSKRIKFSNDKQLLSECNFFIITVPTPITRNKKPEKLFGLVMFENWRRAYNISL